MVFYAFGSLLFGFALVAALVATAGNFIHYRAQMVAALRTLSLGGIHRPTMAASSPSGLPLKARLDRPARPAPHLAA
jgi:hypothetical protein